jgi:hypothetical protein
MANPDMREAVAERVAKLRQLDMAAIKLLPPVSQERPSSLGNVTIATHHDVTETGEHQVVVQAVKPRWFGISTAIEVDGFVIVGDGTKRPLAEPEKWPFL